MPQPLQMRVAIACWEPGRVNTGFGAKIGGLGAVMEELPEELILAAQRRNVSLELEILSPCFGHFDRTRLEPAGRTVAILDGRELPFQVFRRPLSAGLSAVYFWDEGLLGWTNEHAIYPEAPEYSQRLYSAVSAAMAEYISGSRFHVVHGQDYHVALIPFYLGDAFLQSVPFHLTIHNASYQGVYPVPGHGYGTLDRIGLPGSRLFHKYFDFFDNLNFLKAGMIKTHELGGRVTTVSGDLKGTWGYAAELREGVDDILRRAQAQKKGGAVREVFVPNRFLDVFEHIPIVGITNGVSERNWPQHLPELKAAYLRELQERRSKGVPLFHHPTVQEEMLSRDHSFDADSLETKAELKRLLHLEAFGTEPMADPILMTVVGRLVEQKNLGLVAKIAELVLQLDPGVKFVVMAAAPDGDPEGKRTEAVFRWLATRHPNRFFYSGGFSPQLSRLILAGGDFCLIPSRFEPCGLVDYEASLLGNVVVARRTGGLAKMEGRAYFYDWLDIGDDEGESEAFLAAVREAVRTYRLQPEEHRRLILKAMAVDASWARSAEKYLDLYRYGLFLVDWRRRRERILGAVDLFASQLQRHGEGAARFFVPNPNDVLDTRLMQSLEQWKSDAPPESLADKSRESSGPSRGGKSKKAARTGRRRTSSRA